MSRNPLALDFDGVLSDSTEECIVTAWNAWRGLQKEEKLVLTPDEVPGKIADCIRSNRCYVKTGGEYVALIQAALREEQIINQDSYDRLVERFRSEITAFSDFFFQARLRLREGNDEHWILLHTPYDGVADGVREVAEHFDVFIVTGKDRSAVERILSSLGLEFETDRIFDKNAAQNKLEFLKHIANRCGISLPGVFMVDDNVIHLLPAHEAGCNVFLAGWGYHTQEHLAIARESQIPRVELHDWVEVLLRREGSRHKPLTTDDWRKL